jgi:hypothetical protein
VHPETTVNTRAGETHEYAKLRRGLQSKETLAWVPNCQITLIAVQSEDNSPIEDSAIHNPRRNCCHSSFESLVAKVSHISILYSRDSRDIVTASLSVSCPDPPPTFSHSSCRKCTIKSPRGKKRVLSKSAFKLGS